MPPDPTLPISAADFALAIADLPLDSLHAKAAEIENSMRHLHSSNAQMLPFADDGDQDCKDAMFENLQVIGRMKERMELLRAEVERRGMRWSGVVVEEEEGEDNNDDGDARANGVLNGDGVAAANGHGSASQMRDAESADNGAEVRDEVPGPQAPSGRLTDEELRRQIEAQIMDDGDNEGVHL